MKKHAVLLFVLLTGCSAVHEKRSTTDSCVVYYTDFATLEDKLQIKLETRGDMASDDLILTVAVRDRVKHALASSVELIIDGKAVCLAAVDQHTKVTEDWYPYEEPIYSENPAYSPHDPSTVSSRQYQLEFSLFKTLLASCQAAIKVSVEDGIVEETLWSDGTLSSEKRMVTELRDHLLTTNPDRFKE